MNRIKSFFVIIGRGRSGTTLFSKILESNSSVSIADEFFFPVNLYKKYYGKTINVHVIKNFVEDVFFERRFENYNFSKTMVKEYLLKKTPNNYQELCIYTYESFSYQKGGKDIILIGDRNPHYALFLPLLKRLFDNIKFIYIVRDYRDNVLSYKNVKFDMNNIYALAYRWLFFNRTILKFKKKYPDSFLLIKYENVILQPVDEIIKACRFLDIDYEDNMMEFYKKKSDNLFSWHTNINSKLNANNIKKWNSVLSKNQLQKIDYICNTVAHKLGYKEKIRFNIILFFKTFIYMIYAKIYTFSETLLFYLPLRIRMKIINLIRDIQGTNET